jgi:hypothetical protein
MVYRRSRRRDSDAYSDASYGSDSEPSEVDDVFDQGDQADDAGYENSQTDIDDFDPDDFIKDDIDAEDGAELFEGNLHPPEYYVRCIQDFNESAFNNEDYCPGTTVLLDGIEELWNQRVAWSVVRLLLARSMLTSCRYCEFVSEALYKA